MDFSETNRRLIIIGLVILAINSVGSKKQQSSKNQPGRQPGRTIFPEASTQTPQREEQKRVEMLPHHLPWTKFSQSCAELTKRRSERLTRPMNISPRAPRRAQPQPSRRPQVQPLERREPQTEWRPQPRPAEQPAATVPKPEPAATILTPEEEGKSALARPQTSARPVTQTVPVQESEAETESIDISDIDWRKAVIAAEILNRKY